MIDDRETATYDAPVSGGSAVSEPVIVVGVDGSEPSKHAVASGADQVRLRRASLLVITADTGAYRSEPTAVRSPTMPTARSPWSGRSHQ